VVRIRAPNMLYAVHLRLHVLPNFLEMVHRLCGRAQSPAIFAQFDDRYVLAPNRAAC